MVQGNESVGGLTVCLYKQLNLKDETMTKIKTLAEIGEQYDRITDYLTDQGRFASACKVDEIFNGILDRILIVSGVTEIDDESIEMASEEPVFASEYQRLP